MAQLKLEKFVKIAQSIVIYVRVRILLAHLVSQAIHWTKVSVQNLQKNGLLNYVQMMNLSTEKHVILAQITSNANLDAPTFQI